MSDRSPSPWARLTIGPALDLLRGLDLALGRGSRTDGLRRLAAVFAGTLVGWWLYVPIHELLHALGCLATGGTVSRLEISPLYLGELWASIWPWVVAEGPYAGRLAGFDTGGSDAVYLVTVFAPYLLTLFPGVWCLRRGAASSKPWLYGLGVPLALAPFVSITGDAYEIGSIVVTRWGPWSTEAWREIVRGDDVFVVYPAALEADPAALVPLVLATCTGLIWALATYRAGDEIAARLGAPPLPPIPSLGR